MSKYIKPPTLSTSFSENGKRTKKRFENILSSKTKKTSVFSFIPVMCLVAMVSMLVSNAEDKQIIETRFFSVSIPKAWKAVNVSAELGELELIVDGKTVGYADIRNANFSMDENGNPLFGAFDNHSNKLSEEKLEEFLIPVYRLVIEHTRPAAEMDDTVTTLEHYLFLNSEADFTVNLALNIELLSAKQRLEIAKSVVVSSEVAPYTVTEVYELADIWEKAWMSRDGKSRYDIMSEEMKADFEAEQERVNGDKGSPWVIRWSSPWVTSYSIQIKGDTALITYKYTDSTTAVYEGYERITIGQENGRAVVVGQNPNYEETILK